MTANFLRLFGVAPSYCGKEVQEQLEFFYAMEEINQIIYDSDDPEQMLWRVLATAFSKFECDRIWLFYPCDPNSPTYRIPVEITRSEYPGAHQAQLDVPMKPHGNEYCAKVLATRGAVFFGPNTDPPIFSELRETFAVQSQLSMALYPRVGKPWMLGVHQCSHERTWNDAEVRLFEAIAKRIGEGLSTLLLLRDLRESQERLDLAIQGSRDGLWDWPDARRSGMWWSPRVYEMLGYQPGEHAPSSKKLLSLIHSKDRERVLVAFRKHLADTQVPCEAEFRILSKSGAYLCIWARGMSIRDEKGRIRRMSGSFQDITERRRAENGLREYRDRLEDLVEERTAKLRRINSELEVANKDLEAFSYTVSHDLRSPLVPIIGFARMLKDIYGSRLDDRALDMLSEIIKQTDKMLNLIDDLLAFAHVGHISEPPQPEYPNDAIKEILAELSEDFPAVWKLTCIQDDLPLVHLPRCHLLQIFSNLIGNALRYACTGKGPIEVRGEKSGDKVRFSVRDHGPGLRACEKMKIFEPFYRGTTRKKVSGTGLGLAIIAKIAKFYQGAAWVEDTPGGGCTFVVELMDSTPDN